MDNKIVKNIIDKSKGDSRDAPLGPLTLIFMKFAAKILQTRRHSSRMRTVHCSGRLSCHTPPCHAHPPAMHTSTMHSPPATHAPPCHACPLPHMPPHHVHPPAMHAAPATHGAVDRMTDACENIIFPQLLLRAVNILPQIQRWPTLVLEILYPPLNMSLKL